MPSNVIMNALVKSKFTYLREAVRSTSSVRFRFTLDVRSILPLTHDLDAVLGDVGEQVGSEGANDRLSTVVVL